MNIIAVGVAALAVFLLVVGSWGLFVCRDAYDRLHAAAPATTFAPGLVALGLIASEGIGSGTSVRALFAALVVAGTGPILSHATARAERLRQRGDLEVHDDDEAPR